MQVASGYKARAHNAIDSTPPTFQSINNHLLALHYVMKFSETLGFDSEKYRASLRDYCHNHLRDNERLKRQERAGSATGMAVSVLAAAHTGGMSLASGALSKRKHYVAGKKHKYILEEMERRGLDCHERKKRDILVPMGAALAAGAIAQGIGAGMEHAAAATAGQHAYDIVSQPVQVAPGYWVEQYYYVPDAAGNAAYAALQSGETSAVKLATRTGVNKAVQGGLSSYAREKSVRDSLFFPYPWR